MPRPSIPRATRRFPQDDVRRYWWRRRSVWTGLVAVRRVPRWRPRYDSSVHASLPLRQPGASHRMSSLFETVMTLALFIASGFLGYVVARFIKMMFFEHWF